LAHYARKRPQKTSANTDSDTAAASVLDEKITQDLINELQWNRKTDMGTIMAAVQEKLKTIGEDSGDEALQKISLLDIVMSWVRQQAKQTTGQPHSSSGSGSSQVGSSSTSPDAGGSPQAGTEVAAAKASSSSSEAEASSSMDPKAFVDFPNRASGSSFQPGQTYSAPSMQFLTSGVRQLLNSVPSDTRLRKILNRAIAEGQSENVQHRDFSSDETKSVLIELREKADEERKIHWERWDSCEEKSCRYNYENEMRTWREDLANKRNKEHQKNPASHLLEILDYLKIETNNWGMVRLVEDLGQHKAPLRCPSAEEKWIKKNVVKGGPSQSAYPDPTDTETLLAKEKSKIGKNGRKTPSNKETEPSAAKQVSVEYLNFFETTDNDSDYDSDNDSDADYSSLLLPDDNHGSSARKTAESVASKKVWVIIRRVFDSSNNKEPAKVSIHWPNYADFPNEKRMKFGAYHTPLANARPEDRAEISNVWTNECDWMLAKYDHGMRLV